MLRGSSSKAGRPPRKASGELVLAKPRREEYRVNSEVVLLTYSGFAGLEHFHRFVSFVRGCLKKWGVKRWGTTLEAYETEGLHVHLVLQFASLVDRAVSFFAFEGTRPNVSNGDYLGEGLAGCFEQKTKHTSQWRLRSQAREETTHCIRGFLLRWLLQVGARFQLLAGGMRRRGHSYCVFVEAPSVSTRSACSFASTVDSFTYGLTKSARNGNLMADLASKETM